MSEHPPLDAVGPLRLAVGAARLTMSPWAPDRTAAMRVLHAALDAGVRLLDTANCYSDSVATTGANEELVAEALRTWSGDADDVLVSTKGGRWRPGDGSWLPDGRPASLRAAIHGSLRSLGVERLGLYSLHAVDPKVPIADSAGALVEAHGEGLIAHIGLSNVTPADVDAAGIPELAAIQNKLSPGDHDRLAHAQACASADTVYVAWGALDGVRSDDEAQSCPPFGELAAEIGCSPRQLAVAWVRSVGASIIPLVGPTTVAQVAEIAGAPDTVTHDRYRLPGLELSRQPGHA